MFQTCQHCSYESPIGARFCRQCGAQLFAETEASAASTRNYGRQESAPPVAAPGSGHLPPSVADAIAGETERYYQASYIPAGQLKIVVMRSPFRTLRIDEALTPK